MAASRGFVSSIYPLEVLGLTVPGYAALYSVIVNFLVAVALSPVLDRLWHFGRQHGAGFPCAAGTAAPCRPVELPAGFSDHTIRSENVVAARLRFSVINPGLSGLVSPGEKKGDSGD